MNDITKIKDDKSLENSECITSDLDILHKAMEEVRNLLYASSNRVFCTK